MACGGALNERHRAPHTHTHTEDERGLVDKGRPPPNHQATFLEGEIEEEIEEVVQNEDLDFECMDAQDRPSFEALAVSYKRRER